VTTESAGAVPKPSGAVSGPSTSPARQRLFSITHYLAALILLFVVAAFTDRHQGSQLIEAIILTLVLLSACVAIGARRRILYSAIALVIPALVLRWLNHFRPDLFPASAYFGATLVFVVFISARLFLFVLRARRVTSEVLSAAIATYLTLALAWAFAYILVAKLDPEAFGFTAGPASVRAMEGFSSLYFSLVTLSTVGYGDIVPLSNGTRLLATAEAVAGTFFVTMLVARLVSGYAAGQKDDA